MKTKVTLSDQLRNNIVFENIDSTKDLSEHYLNFDIIVVDNFISQEDIMHLQDSQIKNKNNPSVGSKVPIQDLIKKPDILFRNTESARVLRDTYYKISNFAFKRYGLFNDNIVRSYFDGTLASLKAQAEQVNVRFRLIDEPDDMHLDSYTGEPLRMFVNLDAAPRVWRTSYNQLEGLNMLSKKRFFDTIEDIDLLKEKTTNNQDLKSNINNKINKEVLYDYQNKKNRSPYHELELASGALWICNSKRVSHQVVKGNRLLVFSRNYPALSITQDYLPKT